jgi:hypothetical protein
MEILCCICSLCLPRFVVKHRFSSELAVPCSIVVVCLRKLAAVDNNWVF